MGGQSSEREISLRTGQAILKALREKGYQAFSLDPGKDIGIRLREEGVEIAFIALHGRLGEDGCIQGLLEIMGIPYTGSGVMASALAMNKIMAKEIFAFHKIPTPEFVSFKEEEIRKKKIEDCCKISLPVIVKPVEEGSTIGVTIVRERKDLRGAVKKALSFGNSVLIEKYIEGREMTVSVLNGEVLPVIEILPRSGFYNYKAKYTKGFTNYLLPASLEKKRYKEIQELALKAYKALGCEGAARVDFMVDKDQRPYCLEVNTIPGLTETSLLPQAAQAAGIDFNELVERMLKGASLKVFKRSR